MPRDCYHLTVHARFETIPLRTGIVPPGSKVYLDEIEIDEDGSAQQTKGQRDAGRFHILANVWLNAIGEERLPGRWRLVTAEPEPGLRHPPIFTLLPLDRSSARSEANLTDFLKRAREKNDKPWLDSTYIATTLHSLLMTGRLRDHDDLASHINAKMMEPVVAAKDAAEREREAESHARLAAERDRDSAHAQKELATQAAEQAEHERSQAQMAWEAAEQERQQAEDAKREALSQVEHVNAHNRQLETERDLLLKALAANEVRANLPAGKALESEVARLITKSWPSKTGSSYLNIGVEATIKDVSQKGSQIYITYINKSGDEQTVNDFGYYGFVQAVFNYLKKCKDEKRRAVFILTYKSDDARANMRLASDTMMLAQYAGLWRGN